MMGARSMMPSSGMITSASSSAPPSKTNNSEKFDVIVLRMGSRQRTHCKGNTAVSEASARRPFWVRLKDIFPLKSLTGRSGGSSR